MMNISGHSDPCPLCQLGSRPGSGHILREGKSWGGGSDWGRNIWDRGCMRGDVIQHWRAALDTGQRLHSRFAGDGVVDDGQLRAITGDYCIGAYKIVYVRKGSRQEHRAVTGAIGMYSIKPQSIISRLFGTGCCRCAMISSQAARIVPQGEICSPGTCVLIYIYLTYCVVCNVLFSAQGCKHT